MPHVHWWRSASPAPQRHQAARLAAAALIAAALAEAPQTVVAPAEAQAAWMPGNPAILGAYTINSFGYGGGISLDVDGDGVPDFVLTATNPGNGVVYHLQPLSTGGVDNEIYAIPPAARPVTGPAAGGAQLGGGGSLGARTSRPAKGDIIVVCLGAMRFDSPDPILTDQGPTDGPTCQASLAAFSVAGYAGLVFQVPPPPVAGAQHRASAVGGNEFGYLGLHVSGDTLYIGSVGIQPNSSPTPTRVHSWGQLRSIYR